ncbi:MAG: PAS-domain containing protein, partial [Rhodospirillales bacterium]|nr:PAS-domain containing protein [Rhodospirillales bacterium]
MTNPVQAAPLAEIVAALPQGVILFDADQRVVLTNPAYDRIMAGAPAHPGQSVEALIRARIEAGEYGPGDPATQLADHLAYDYARPQLRRRQRPNGTVIENRWVPLADGGFMGVIADITPLAGAEATLRRRAAETETLLAGLPHGVILWGPDQRLIVANALAATLLGVPAASLAPGRTHGEMIDALLAGGHLGSGAMARGMAGELKARDWTRPWVRHFVNATGRFVERRSDPLPGGMSLTTLTDITERRDAEHALRRARDAAEAASGAKSRFLATMSHELRTPLNAVIGYAEALAREGAALGGPTADYADAIEAAGRKLLDLIDTLLDVARLEGGGFALAEEEVEIPRLIHTSLRQFAPVASAGEIALAAETIAPDDTWPRILADRRRLAQALHHLLSNAVKFTEPGGEVRVGAGWDADGATLTVHDSGIGIAEADLARIFDPFVQVDSRLSRRFSGAGLGLYVARALIESHGGTL